MQMTPEPIEIFISHSARNDKLAEAFVTLICFGCDVSERAIFCSSLGGIQNGEYFVKTILTKLQEAKLVLAIVSSDYVKSQFCLAEAGAAELRDQIQRKCKCFVLLVPPVTYSDINGVFHGIQAGGISDDNQLSDLKDLIQDKLGKRAKERIWVSAKKAFLNTVGGVLYEQEMIRLIYRGVKVVHKEIEKPTPQVEAGLTFKRKYVLDLRNETGKPITLKNAFLDCKSNDAKPHPESQWHVFQTFKNAKAEGEHKQMTVGVGERFRVKVAFDNSYPREDLETRALNDELGTIKIPMVIGGITVWYVKRLIA
jgi:hypothetical protein